MAVAAKTGVQTNPTSYDPYGAAVAAANPRAAQNPLAMPGQAQPYYVSPYAGQTVDGYQDPVMPQFNMPWNSSMSELPWLQGELGNTHYNTQPLTNYENYAENPNLSPWASAATTQSYLQQQQAQNQEQGSAAGAEASARGNLALQGGLSSGARERVAEQGQEGLLSGMQNIADQGLQNRSQIAQNDAAQKLQAQAALPGLETQAYQAQLEPIQMEGQAYAQDTANQMNAANALNQFNMQAFNTEGQMYGANKTAQAQMNAPQPSCWLITELTKHGMKVPEDEAMLLQKFKYYMGRKYKAYSVFYIKHCGELVRRMNELTFDWKRFEWFNTALLALLRSGEHDAASRFFISTVTDLCKSFWPECGHRVYRKLCDERMRRKLRAMNVSESEYVPQVLRGKCLANLPQEAFQ